MLQNETLTGTIYIASGPEPVLETATVKSTNVEQTIVPQEGVAGFSSVTVEALELQAKTVTLSNQQQVIEPDSGKDGLSSVTVPAAPLSLSNAYSDITDNATLSGNGQISTIKVKNLVIDGYTAIGEHAFRNNNFLESISSTSVTNDNGEAIGNAFYGCGNLKSVNLPNFAATGGSYMFYNCRNLETVNMPKITILGGNMFENCSKLTSLRLENCQFLGASSLKGCTLLHDLYLGRTSGITTINSNTFSNSGIATDSTARIHVPADLEQTYKNNSGWSAYSDKIVGDYA